MNRQPTDTQATTSRAIEEQATAAPVRELSGRLAGRSLAGQVLVLAIWPLLEQALGLMVGTVDQALAGWLQPNALAEAASDAIGAGMLIDWLVRIVHSAVGIGASALIARAVGGRHQGLARSALGQSMLLAIAAGAVTAVGLFMASFVLPPLINVQGLGGELCAQYIRYLALAAPAGAVLMIGNACMRGAGETRTPFVIMLIVNVINVAASVLLVYAPEPIGGRGVAGIAIGTVIAWWVGGGLVLFALTRGWGGVRLLRHRLSPHRHTMMRIVRVGAPTLAEHAGGMWLATFIVLTIVGRLGDQGIVGAHMIAIRVEAFSFQPGFALGIAAATLVGQYLGLGDALRARQAALLCAGSAVVLMGGMGIAFMLAPEWFASVFTHSDTMRATAVGPIRICGGIQVFFALYMVFAQALRGAGDTRTTMIMTYVSVAIFRVPCAYLFGVVLGYGLNGVWIGLCADLTFKGIIFTGRFLHGGWAKTKV